MNEMEYILASYEFPIHADLKSDDFNGMSHGLVITTPLLGNLGTRSPFSWMQPHKIILSIITIALYNTSFALTNHVIRNFLIDFYSQN